MTPASHVTARPLTVFLACLCAFAVFPGWAEAAPVPAMQKAKIHALLSPYDFYPASLPNGLLFIGFKQTSLSPTVCGSNITTQFAAAGGREIDWSSSRDCDNQGAVKCNSTGYPGYSFGIDFNLRRATMAGRQVFFSPGNHGSNAWACIPLKVGGIADWAVAGIWESNFITPTQAMQLVAHARR